MLGVEVQNMLLGLHADSQCGLICSRTGSRDLGIQREEQPMGRGLEDSQEEEALGLGMEG